MLPQKNSLQTTAFGLLLALGLGAVGTRAQAVETNANRIAVIVGLDPGSISPATVELYRRVSSRLIERNTWTVINDLEIKQHLVADQRLRTLGTIAAIDRKLVVGAMARNKLSKKKRMIRPVQAMVDTLALEGAVIVDCRVRDMRMHRCAVYYYDRAAGRITAASAKDFRVPIVDATRWAPVLVDQMIAGIEGYKSAKTKARVDRMMLEGQEDEKGRRPVVGVDLLGTSITDPAKDIRTLPSIGVSVGTQGDTFQAMLIGELGKTSGENGGLHYELSEQSIGLAFAARSRALEAIYWDLGITALYVMRKAERTAGAGVGDELAGLQEEKSLKLRLHPGLYWEFAEAATVGPAVYWVKDLPLTSHAEGSFENERIRTGSFGLGMRLRVVL